MRISLQLPIFKFPGGAPSIGPTLKTVAQTADAGGFYSLWVMDHFFQLGMGFGPDEDPMLEGYSTLSYLAGVTERVKLGTLVTGVIYRYPAVLVKTVTTLDVLSGGRAYMGIGAAWYEHEAKSLGIPYPSTKERFEMLEDALRLAHHMWDGDRSAFDGTHVHAEMPISNPQPLSQPHPPILIGGMGERKTLRLAAQYADAINFFGRAGAETLTQKLGVLREHCDAVGRDFDTIEKTTLNSVHLTPGEMSVADVIATFKEQASLGFTHAIVNMPNVHEITPVETMVKEVIPAVAEF